jgi:hypothetical protein
VSSVPHGTAVHVTYEGNAEGDPDRIVYQASISDRTRTCRYGEGGGWVTVAIAGRVVPGPRGRAGNVNLPIRVTAQRGSSVIYSQVFRHPVTVTDVSGATQFVLNMPDIPIEGGIDRSVQMTVGFDEGSGR